MAFAFDCDEVLARYVDAFVAFHNERYGTSLTRASFPVYSIAKVVGVSIAEERRRLAEFHRTPHFDGIKPYDDALYAVPELRKGDELAVITSRQDEIIGTTCRWLDGHFPGAFAATHFSEYYASSDRLSKVEICLRNDVTRVAEDSLEQALACAARGIRVFLINKPWNQADRLPSGIVRVESLREMVNYL